MGQDRLRHSGIIGRRSECETLDRLAADAGSGRSRVLVLRGEAGVGKSALLRHLSGRVTGWQVTTAVGVEPEMELAFSGLHQLCRPLLGHLDGLPAPQREAVETVFGESEGPPPDRFLVGIAMLTLVAAAAERRPLLCIVDDAQWLDHTSAQVLAFVARRLLAEPIALVCAARTGLGDDVFSGLPELPIGGLEDGDARALLLDHVSGPLDAAVRDQIVAESHGNPLALVELSRTWNAADLAGGFGLPGNQQVVGRIELSYARRLQLLPAETRVLVLAAAAEPMGDPVLLYRAAETMGIDMAAAAPAVDARLLTIDARVEFAHPLVRSGVYGAATTEDRRLVHRALAEATDPGTDPDRRAWHRARAAFGPAEEIAGELELSAGRAQARGGLAAAAGFLRRAVALSVDPARRAERALAAAETSLQAGAFDEALRLVASAEAEALDEFQQARVDLVRGHAVFASGLGGDAPPLLLKAARRLEPVDLHLARETYLIAWAAAIFAGEGHAVVEICRAVRTLSYPRTPRPLDLLLDGLARLTTHGRAAATPVLQRAAKALVDLPVEDVLRWGWVATGASDAVWDVEGSRAVAARNVRLARAAGALAELPVHLNAMGLATAWTGDLAHVAALVAEADGVAAAIGSPIAPYTALRLAALQGGEAAASTVMASAIEHASAGGQGLAATQANWAAAVLYNGLGRYEEAASYAQQATANAFVPWMPMWALPELVEAAARVGDLQEARVALDRLCETTRPAGTDFALGIEARSRAVLSDGEAADETHREAIDRLNRSGLGPEVARARLLYGEWLRRGGRRVDAREQLRAAHDTFVAIGMSAFAERARRELAATGAKARRRSIETRRQLTPQEEQVARLARDGLSNPEIAAELFISPRTVEYHLRKVFTTLGINSRRQLRSSLPVAEQPVSMA